MENVMELKGVSKYYLDGEEQAIILDELDLTVQAGEFVAILGPSGSGKSTLLSIAGLLLSADGGRLLLDVTKLSQKEQTRLRRHKLGFIFQSHQLLSYLTVQDQLEQVARFDRDSEKDKSRAEISQLLGELGMAGSAHKFPRQLSGGQKQRAGIARAFIHQPKLILADEPTASLDEARGGQVTELIRKEVTERKTAAIMVTHDERILDLVDTVYRLKHGKLVKES
ncbi:lipoprotein releasing system ATP-binding protein [Chlamydia trachomatis]|nr:lipoprotein releasing system ATP-binding protein [Chlamydia trachomatis]